MPFKLLNMEKTSSLGDRLLVICFVFIVEKCLLVSYCLKRFLCPNRTVLTDQLDGEKANWYDGSTLSSTTLDFNYKYTKQLQLLSVRLEKKGILLIQGKARDYAVGHIHLGLCTIERSDILSVFSAPCRLMHFKISGDLRFMPHLVVQFSNGRCRAALPL